MLHLCIYSLYLNEKGNNRGWANFINSSGVTTLFERITMAKHIKKPAKSPMPMNQSSDTAPEPLKIPAADFEQALEEAFDAGDDTRALEVLDAAPRWIKKQPEIMLIRASVLLSLGDYLEALRLLREIERKNPRIPGLHPSLAMLYMDRDWPAHALQSAKRALSDRDLPDDSRASLEEIIQEGTAFLQDHATEFGLSFETMQRAAIFHEQAQIAMDENKLSEAEYFAREAIKIAPNWSPPHNNRARALYFSGKTTEAIAVSEAVLARDPKNVFALSSLVTYYLGLNQPEKAKEYAGLLEKLSPKFPLDNIANDHIVSSLAVVDDTPALWKIAKRYLDAPADTLFGRSWHCLAVAAIRIGKWNDAVNLLKKPPEEERSPAAQKLLAELETVAAQRYPRLAWMPPGYPGVDLFAHPKVMAEWEALQQNFSGPLTPSRKRKLDSFFQKYPFMVVAMKRLLWIEESNPVILPVLEEMETPEVDAEILRFALSQVGTRESRINAIMVLIQSGRYTGPKTVKIWYEDQEEWHDVELNTQRIGDIQANVRPNTLAVIEKAAKTKNIQEAIALLRKAVEMEPTSPIAVFNLGVLLAQNGKTEEGEALISRSVEVDPNYTYGHASIALSEADKGHEQEALDHLRIVTRADVITPETAVIASLAWAALTIQKRDWKSARQHLDTAAQLNPEHRLIADYEKMLKEAEDWEEKIGFLLEFQRESAHRAHQKLLKTPLTAEMDLHGCLETNTKDMLVGSAHFLRTSSSGKKGQLVSRLAEILLDEESLRQILVASLEKKEREALQWLLETGGIRPWKEFVRKYGDDVDESKVWNYHEPKSIPGRLRRSGLLYSGTLEGQQVAFIPGDVRLLLRKLLK
jgi:tetratricopeptide (TPR) repeat protein